MIQSIEPGHLQFPKNVSSVEFRNFILSLIFLI